VVSNEMYTLRGDRISGSRVAGLFVKRQVLANGNRAASLSLGR
jgi:hypothetical protein